MKLFLPKLLMMAVMATFAYSQDATVITGAGSYEGDSLVLNGTVVMQGESGDYDDNRIYWDIQSGTGTLSGNGRIYSSGGPWHLEIGGGGDGGLYSIGEGVTLENVDILSLTTSSLVVHGALKDVVLDLNNSTEVDISRATVSGKQDYLLSSGSTLVSDRLEVKGDVLIESIRGYNYNEEDVVPVWGCVTLRGDLVLNGLQPEFTEEQRFDYSHEDFASLMRPYGVVQFWVGYEEGEEPEPFVSINVTGSITIKSETAILFANEGDAKDSDNGIITWLSDYRLPTPTDVLFICSSVNEESLSLLKPYAFREDSWSDWSGESDVDGGYVYIKPVDDREFYAKSGSDGLVYIYLGEQTNSGEPDVPVQPEIPVQPDFTVKPGEVIVLGGNGDQLPSVLNPVQMQGGVADASGLEDELLNNKVITGENGTLQTGHNQTMQLTGSDKIGYSVVGLEGSQHGANLEISSTSNLILAGEKYDAARTKVLKGTVTISSRTTIGTGADGDVLDLTSKGVSATNFGTIAADVEIANESTLLNQGKVKGDVSVFGKSAAMVNNGSVDGLLAVGAGALLSGSGTAGALILESGGSLNVGNSPGYQKYGNLTLHRGSTVSFTVDGVQAATLSNAGSGTHSVLTTDELTITPGTGTVTINVEVTMGIVNAGFEPVEVTLATAGEGNATAADFTINLDDNNLLEEGSEVAWDAATQSLTLSGSVNKAALAVLMDGNSANVANTMWASANAVHEMARTAEHQFLVGMPGQTTFWGAAMGSFMDVSGEQGFTSNLGGYAVGLQHAFTEGFRAGFALGQSFGTFKSDDDQLKADQTALMPVLTAQYVCPLDKTSSLTVNGHVAYGAVSNEADTYQAGATGKAEWDDQVLNVGARAAWNKQVSDNSSISIFAGLTYQNVEQDSFTEEYTGGECDYRSGSMSSLSLPLGVTWRGVYQMEGTNVFVPEVTVAYVSDITRENPEVKSNACGYECVGEGTNIGRNAFELNVGANWMFDSSWSLGAFYTLEARSKQINQSVNAALRYSF